MAIKQTRVPQKRRFAKAESVESNVQRDVCMLDERVEAHPFPTVDSVSRIIVRRFRRPMEKVGRN